MEEIQPLGTAEGVGHAVVDVDGFVNSLKDRLRSIPKPPSPSTFHICRVPATIRKDNHVYYNPKIVSIGPFHRPRRNLRAMEEHKWRYLQKVLDDCHLELEECVKKLTEIPVEKARQCYSGNINMPDDEFVKMMLLDGFFIIRLLLLGKNIEENDPILRNIWMMPAIAADMLLLENQLPFCVLECLANCIGYDTKDLNQEAFLFFSKNLPDTLDFGKSVHNETLVHKTSDEIHHLLHLLHWSLKLAPPNTEKHFSAQGYERVTDYEEAGASSITVQTQERVLPIPTATELEEAGVRFKRKEGGRFLDVTFENGVMQLPRLQITDYTNSVFRNIIAFEQCFPDSGGAFTSYCIFIDSLVNTPRDVQILKQSHIIESKLGSDKEVALLFNQLCKEITESLDTGSVGKASKYVKEYAEQPWHKWRATLKRDYFSNPWAAISLIAAIYAIFLASVSTYYAVF